VRDKVRPEAVSAVTQLSAMGVPHLVMLSGDIEETARVVARAVVSRIGGHNYLLSRNTS